MFPRSRLGIGLLVVYTLINFGGLIYAAAMGEAGHAVLHAVLLIPVGVLLSLRRGSTRSEPASALPGSNSEFPGRLTNLEQSIDAVAIEVERIVEGQRNLVNLLAEKETRRAEEQGAPSEARKDRSST
jgi:hypothetical protein